MHAVCPLSHDTVMLSTTTSPAARCPQPRTIALLALAAVLGLALWIHGPIPQWPSYHRFADQRTRLGLPNAADVLSNLPFALVGAVFLRAMRGRPRSEASLAWLGFALALIATAAGSAFYHWAPHNASLAFDRLPIAWACAALTCAFLTERIDPRSGQPAVLLVALLLASVSVALWWGSEAAGHSDLRPYLFVQFLPMLLVPAALLMRLPRRFATAAPDGAWWGVLLGYGIAKGLEVADLAVFERLGLVSGHTLKHLVAAAAAAWLLRAVWRASQDDQLR